MLVIVALSFHSIQTKFDSKFITFLSKQTKQQQQQQQNNIKEKKNTLTGECSTALCIRHVLFVPHAINYFISFRFCWVGFFFFFSAVTFDFCNFGSKQKPDKFSIQIQTVQLAAHKIY